MGGCFCCSFRRRAVSNRSPTYIYCPQDLEEWEQLSSSQDASSRVSLDANLDTSIPDTYQAPPVPLPYDVDSAHSQTIADSFGNSVFGTLRNMDCKSKAGQDQEYLTSAGDEFYEVKRTAPSGPIDEEDVCPICLEEYVSDNPCIMTKCEHDFHLSCILEWMERSDTCPVCDQIMMIDDMYT
ncbi:probable E3 ubiquitin-protein ligase RHB1A isoform X2 [Typha angustifolia]|uniref:probable E3 ubiquitin-protein ligase RHB1A isoform X2 n=1 Tax=Typha angustifolia TaxID=59011 RepID=UPI003C2F218C